MSGSTLPNFISHNVLRGRYLFLDLNPKNGSRGSVACAGWEECSSKYEIRRKGFRFPAIEYIAGGDWELQTDKGKWKLQPGSCFTYGPDVSYSLRAISKVGLSKYFLDFTDDSAAAGLRKVGLKPGTPCVLLQRRWIQDLLDQLIDLSQLPLQTGKQVAAKITDLLFERFQQDLKRGKGTPQSRQSFERCRQYLSENYIRVSSLFEAAKHCGVSQVHLSRLFRQHTTESPLNYVTRLKINHAAQLIVRDNLQIKKAAAEVGFDDPYHFSRVFKRVQGIAPSHFSAK